VQEDAAAIYSSSTIGRDIDDFFLLNQETRQFPTKNAPPLVIFRQSTHPTQSTSVYSFKVKYSPFGYHSS
jgi:hypothetical protein